MKTQTTPKPSRNGTATHRHSCFSSKSPCSPHRLTMCTSAHNSPSVRAHPDLPFFKFATSLIHALSSTLPTITCTSTQTAQSFPSRLPSFASLNILTYWRCVLFWCRVLDLLLFKDTVRVFGMGVVVVVMLLSCTVVGVVDLP